MEHVTLPAPRANEQHNRAEERNNSTVLRVQTTHGVLTSTQAEALADIAEELSGALIELAAHGEIVLHGVRQLEASRVITALTLAGLGTTESDADEQLRAQGATALPGRAEPGLQHVELSVPGGSVSSRQLRDLARLARTYADCELSVTPSRNLLILNMPRANFSLLLREPVLRELRPA